MEEFTTNTAGIKHSKSRPMVLVRDEYLFITGEDHCAAAVLAALEHWINHLGKNSVKRSHGKLSSDMIGLYAPKRIASGIGRLESLGLISVSGNKGEVPSYGLNVETINSKLETYVPFAERTSVKRDNHPGQKTEVPPSNGVGGLSKDRGTSVKRETPLCLLTDIIDENRLSIELEIDQENRTSEIEVESDNDPWNLFNQSLGSSSSAEPTDEPLVQEEEDSEDENHNGLTPYLENPEVLIHDKVHRSRFLEEVKQLLPSSFIFIGTESPEEKERLRAANHLGSYHDAVQGGKIEHLKELVELVRNYTSVAA